MQGRDRRTIAPGPASRRPSVSGSFVMISRRRARQPASRTPRIGRDALWRQAARRIVLSICAVVGPVFLALLRWWLQAH